MGFFVTVGCVSAEPASGLLLNINPAGGGVRRSLNSRVRGEGVLCTLCGMGISIDATGEKDRSGIRISGRVGGRDGMRAWGEKLGLGRGESRSTSWEALAADSECSVTWLEKGESTGTSSSCGGRSASEEVIMSLRAALCGFSGTGGGTVGTGKPSLFETSAYCAAWKGIIFERDRSA